MANSVLGWDSFSRNGLASGRPIAVKVRYRVWTDGVDLFACFVGQRHDASHEPGGVTVSSKLRWSKNKGNGNHRIGLGVGGVA